MDEGLYIKTLILANGDVLGLWRDEHDGMLSLRLVGVAGKLKRSSFVFTLDDSIKIAEMLDSAYNETTNP